MHGGSRRGSHPQARPGQARRSGQAKSGQGKPGQGGAGQGRADSRGTEPRTAQYGPVPDSERLTRLLEPVVHALDMDLEGIRITSAGRRRILRVIVDADGGVSLDDIALASREFSAKLENAAEMGDQPYTLEVSSPGVDRPLTQPRHWRRAIGRLVVAPLTVGTGGQDGNGAATAEGRIMGADASGVTVEHDGEARVFSYADLGPGRVQVEFGHFDDLSNHNLGNVDLGDGEQDDDEVVEED
jgi:ribosome maturation factor RimP